MKHTPGTPSPSRHRRAQTHSETDDIDLSELIRERDATQEGPSRQGHVTGRRPGIRTGGRIRMDVANSTAGGPRQTPIPGAPRYRRNRKPRNWVATIFTSLLVIGAVAGIVYAFITPKLAIRSIEIDGVSGATARSLEHRIAANPLGHNILAYVALHGRTLQRQMASAEPDFATAHIGIGLPGTLRVGIEMRKPYALLTIGSSTSSAMYIADDRGVPIEITEKRPKSLLKIMIPADSATDAARDGPIVLGRVLPGNMKDSIHDAYALIDQLRSRPALASVKSIQVDNSNNLGLNMTHHLKVKLGQPEQMNAKLTLLNSLLTEHPNLADEALYIDVSAPSRPAMMPKPVGNPKATTATKTIGQTPNI